VLISTALVGVDRLWATVVINVVVIGEAILICALPQHRRLGDHIADTRIAYRMRKRAPVLRVDSASKRFSRPSGFGELG